MNGELIAALEQLHKEKDIPMASLIEAIEAAMESAYRRHYGVSEDIRLEIDTKSRTVRIIARRPVPTTGTDQSGQPVVTYVEHEVDLNDFGRIAAQTAKQVILQRVREAERDAVYQEFSARVGEVVTAEVQRRDARYVYLTIDRTEVLLPVREQVPGESFRFGEKIKVFILEVRRTQKGPQIVVSRTHPGLVVKLFELEVPEVYDGIVEIRGIAREPGARSKVAVWSNDPQVDPVGACVGHRGTRVQAIVDELRGEKIDIVRYSDDPREYLRSALSPARVNEVIVNEAEKKAIVIAPDDQLSLAIGRRGQNVRLAAQLTGWHIDIHSETQWAQHGAAIVSAAQTTQGQPPATQTAEDEAVAAEQSEALAKSTEGIRVVDLAKELGVDTKDLVEILQEEGIDVTSHVSLITPEQAQMVRQLLMGGEGTLEELGAADFGLE
ncbi:MAG: transcription termination/antitermination protein NusA [Armatimonadetes bacterium]|nr:transcription termination/antitermination protein NusA [Armatimonadota bacterium]